MSFFMPIPGGNDEEDDFGSLSSNSNLPSLFQDSVLSTNIKKSLVYTAPKQPPMQHSNSQPTMNIITAAAVNCYKLSNEKYEPLQGKIGLALLGNDEAKTYQLILYLNKQKPLASVKITEEFNLTSQPGNFCTFYDDQGQNWAVLFDSKDLTKFLDEVSNVKVKLGATKEKTKAKEPPAAKELVTQEPAVAKNPQTPKTLSDNESTKTKLMSRIAKMGQPILPLSGAIVADNSDSDEVVQTSPEPQIEIVKGKKPRPSPSAKPIHSEALYSHNTMIVPSQISNVPPYQMMSYLPTAVNLAAPSNSGHIEILMSETRTHNSEVRMHLCRLTDKVDAVLNKQSTIPEVQPRLQSTPTELHPQLLSHFQALQREASSHNEKIDRILEWMNKISLSQVNPMPPTPPPRTKIEPDPQLIQLEEQIKRLQSERQEAERRMSELTDRNNALKSLINDHEAKESRFKVQLTQAEQDLDAVCDQLKESQHRRSEAEQKNCFLESKLKEERDHNIQLLSKIEKLQEKSGTPNESFEVEEKIKLLESQLQEKNEQFFQLSAQIQDFKEVKNRSLDAEQKLSQFETSFKEEIEKSSKLSQQNQHLLEESHKWKTVADRLQCKLDERLAKEATDDQNADQVEQIKKIMNKVYKEIIRQFDPHESYSFSDIKGAVSEIIREVTLSMVNDQPAESQTSETVAANNESKGQKQDESVISSSNLEHINEDVIEETEVPDVPSSEDVNLKTEESPAYVTDEHQISAVSDAYASPRERSEADATPLIDAEVKERPLSFLESLHSSLAAARSPNTEPIWKPDPPPPPLFDDFNNDDDDDWLT